MGGNAPSGRLGRGPPALGQAWTGSARFASGLDGVRALWAKLKDSLPHNMFLHINAATHAQGVGSHSMCRTQAAPRHTFVPTPSHVCPYAVTRLSLRRSSLRTPHHCCCNCCCSCAVTVTVTELCTFHHPRGAP
eukprot:359616-Chlamydomonas_euryale.AAC.6